ncbi:hypothetical protein [Solirubrobacter soli]|uniref:hypothetical protein n=1 Tax=Solirubrobacter soli TaxID=363832 RepID=UPI0004089E8B|nr:hypothetical protein [Solirubrobacter soli]
MRPAVAILLAWLVLAAPAWPATPPVVWVPNGDVDHIQPVGGRLYLSGEFTTVGPPVGGWVALNPLTGARDPSWPMIDGRVTAAASDGSGGWYVAAGRGHGDEGPTNSRLLHVRADRTLDPAWNVLEVDGAVLALAVSGSSVFVGGRFAAVGGGLRANLAAVDAGSGLPLPFVLGADGEVLALTAIGGTVYAGGAFTSLGGHSRNRLGAVDAATGAVAAWDGNANDIVDALVTDGATVYAGGDFTGVHGEPHPVVVALDPVTATPRPWAPAFDGGHAIALALSGSTLYVAAITGGIGTELAAVNAASGTLTPWHGDAFGEVHALAAAAGVVYVGGEGVGDGAHETGGGGAGIAAFDSGSGAGRAWAPGFAGDADVLAFAGDTLFAGGAIDSATGVPRAGMAAIDAVTGQPTAFATYRERLDSQFIVAGRRLYKIAGRTVTAVDAASGRRVRGGVRVDAAVYALATSRGRVYVGGEFDRIGGERRARLAAFDPRTGAVTRWAPRISGSVQSIIPAGRRVYVLVRRRFGPNRMVAVDRVSGRVLDWHPLLDSDVRAVAVGRRAVYVAGYFSRVGGRSRDGLAALDPRTARATSWHPRAARTEIAALALSPDESTLYVGGSFTRLGGVARCFAGAFDTATGALTPWDPSPDEPVNELRVSGGQVFAGGLFASIAGRPSRGLAVLDPVTGRAGAAAPPHCPPLEEIRP